MNLGESGTVALHPRHLLSASEFQHLAQVPPEAQWFANLDSAQTRRAYQNDPKVFMAFTGIVKPEEFRTVTRGHVQADLARRSGKAGAGWSVDPAQARGTGLHFLAICVMPMW